MGAPNEEASQWHVYWSWMEEEWSEMHLFVSRWVYGSKKAGLEKQVQYLLALFWVSGKFTGYWIRMVNNVWLSEITFACLVLHPIHVPCLLALLVSSSALVMTVWCLGVVLSSACWASWSVPAVFSWTDQCLLWLALVSSFVSLVCAAL